jgi:hypothetical protein
MLTMSPSQSQLWIKMGISLKQYHKCQNNMGQIWAKIKANYKLKRKLTMRWNEHKFLNDTAKAKRWVWVNNWTNNDQNNEPTKDQNNMVNLPLLNFIFLNEREFFFLFFSLFSSLSYSLPYFFFIYLTSSSSLF